MTRTTAVALLLAAAFGIGLVLLFHRQFQAGEAYPEYSSLRSDAAGTKILYESLARLKSITVVRNHHPLDQSHEAASTILVFGVDPAGLAHDAAVFEELAGRGNRVVVALTNIEANKKQFGELLKRWNVTLPFSQDIVERPLKNGVLVLAPEAVEFSNHALVEEWDPAMVARCLGKNRRIVFDESHLGLMESGSLTGLARRYRLQGFALGVLICAGVFLWRSTSPFPPVPSRAAAAGITGRTSASGLASLLRQNVPPKELTAKAWDLWRRTQPGRIPAARLQNAEAIARNSTDPLTAWKDIEAELRGKRNA